MHTVEKEYTNAPMDMEMVRLELGRVGLTHNARYNVAARNGDDPAEQSSEDVPEPVFGPGDGGDEEGHDYEVKPKK